MGFKIGILTFHNVPNYGASLQAFALKKYLENTSDSTVNIIDYQCAGNSDEFSPKNYLKSAYTSDTKLKTAIKKCLIYLFSKKNYEIKHKKFLRFNEENLAIKPYENIYEEYDFIFCGSDQIWNYEITDGFRKPYFGLDKTESSNTRIVAFSASCGDITEFPAEKKEELFQCVKNIEYIGVREKTLEKELNDAGIQAVNTIDPTFLLTAEDYRKAFNIKDTEKKGYVLEYALRKNSELDAVAQKIATEKGLEIKKICGYVSHLSEKGIFTADPIEFLELLSGADYVVTNSFHGTSFSLIFRKNFNVVLPPSRKGRVTDLLEPLGLGNRICFDITNCDSSDIDYCESEKVLNEKKVQSKKFISNALFNREGYNE